MAAYERSISRAQKIQMDSLQRQLKVTRRPMPSLLLTWTPLQSL